MEASAPTLPSQADKKPRKKKKKKGGDGGAGDGDGGADDGDGGGIEAVANTDGGEAAGTEAAGAGKSASQLKREKQKAAAARKKAAAAAAAAAPDIGEIFSARHETGPEGLSFDEATAALLTASAETAHGVAAADAADALLRAAQAEVDALVPGTNPKLLPKALKWCSTNAAALCSLLDLPAASGGSGAVRPTLGLARLRLLQLLVRRASSDGEAGEEAMAWCRGTVGSLAAVGDPRLGQAARALLRARCLPAAAGEPRRDAPGALPGRFAAAGHSPSAPRPTPRRSLPPTPEAGEGSGERLLLAPLAGGGARPRARLPPRRLARPPRSDPLRQLGLPPLCRRRPRSRARQRRRRRRRR